MLIFFSTLLLFESPAKINLDSTWVEVQKGMYYCELSGDYIAKVGDSKITLLKINPDLFNFELVLSTESDSSQRTITEWCEYRGFVAAINAGMYSLQDHLSGRGFTKNYSHINNAVYKDDFNALAAFNPVSASDPKFIIIDKANQDWKNLVEQYQSVFQSIRMIDNNGYPVFWKNKKELFCSMSILAIDKERNVLFIFARSPYSANDMIKFMQRPELNIRTAMYLEGGPEANIYIKTDSIPLVKFGSYISDTYPTDTNNTLIKMPIILGVKRISK
jgi:hypothetical protein